MSFPASPDVEQALTGWIETVLTGHRAGTDTPPDLDSALPFHRVTVIGGPQIDPTLDRVLVDVDSFGADQADASDAARAVKDQALFTLPGTAFLALGAAVGLVTCSSYPARRPWDNTNLRRYGATYALVVHALSP